MSALEIQAEAEPVTDDDDDLETFLAKSRRRWKVKNFDTEKCISSHEDHTNSQHWVSQPYRISENSKHSEGIASISHMAREHDRASAAAATTAHRWKSEREQKELTFNSESLVTDDLLELEWHLQAGELQTGLSNNSSLFVRQAESSSTQPCHVSIHRQELLPVQSYDVRTNQKIFPGREPQQHSAISHEGSVGCVTRPSTMTNIFRHDGFLSKMKKNPYTSGIFSYPDAGHIAQQKVLSTSVPDSENCGSLLNRNNKVCNAAHLPKSRDVVTASTTKP